MKNLVQEVDELLDVLEDKDLQWEKSVVLRMLDELAKLERIVNPHYYWSDEYLNGKHV